MVLVLRGGRRNRDRKCAIGDPAIANEIMVKTPFLGKERGGGGLHTLDNYIIMINNVTNITYFI